MFLLRGVRILHKKFLVENDENKEYSSCYEFVVQDIESKEIFSKQFQLEIGECYSGYCSAEWLLKSDLKKEDGVGTLHYIPKNKFEFERFKTDFDGNDYFKIYEYDCTYYPSASLELFMNNWIATGREKEKKPIYVFFGESAIGKSFIAHSTNLNVFETDASRSLENLNSIYDIIVVGNKYDFNITDIRNRFLDKNVELIGVGFKNLDEVKTKFL
jgi:hypothetical protein